MARAFAEQVSAGEREALVAALVDALAAPPGATDSEAAARDRFDRVAVALAEVGRGERVAVARGLAVEAPLRRLAVDGLHLAVARYLQLHPARLADADSFRTPEIERWRLGPEAALADQARAGLALLAERERALAALTVRPRSCVWLTAALAAQQAATSLRAAATDTWSPAAGDWAGFLHAMGEEVRDDTLAAECPR